MKMAKVSFEKFDVKPSEINRFIDYMTQMYGPTGPHSDEMVFSESDIRMGLYQRLMYRTDLEFVGDLNDMDIVKDLILEGWAMRARRGVL